MKKLLVLILTVVLALSCLTACDTFNSIFGGKSGVGKEYYENCAVFTFDNFESRICITLDRTGLGEGTIYYQVNLNEGALSVKYADVGLFNENWLLSEFTADDEMPINGSGGYIEGDKIAITFEALSPVSGEIIIAFTEDALKAIHKDKELHEHTITYVSAGESGHFENYTCGCPHDHGAVPHYDENGDYICDACGYELSDILIGSVDVYGGNKSISLSFATRDDYTYIVYYKLKNAHDVDYVELENEFMIADGNTFNCYISGIPAGTYNVKIVATSTIMDESFWITLTNVEVLPQE